MVKRFLISVGVTYALMIPLFGVFWPKTIVNMIRERDV